MHKIGKYEVSGEIGQGGMGKVYLARDSMMGRVVAIKLMSEAQLVDDEMRERFLREARTAGGLRHPNIITIYDLAEEHGVPYIVMEYLEGVDLKQVLKERPDLPLYDRLKIAVQVANGLSYAHHHGIVHRDIKPGNIRVLEGGQVKIMDFGIARVAASEMTRTGLTIGTWHYMSPEQIVGKKVDNRADIWALGVILFEMLTGTRPFQADSITTLVYKIAHQPLPPFDAFGVDVPEPLSRIVQRALAKEPAARYGDAAELARDLENFLSAMSTSVDELRSEIDRDVRKYLQLGTALLIRKEYHEATEAVRRALVLDPENAEGKDLLDRVAKQRDRDRREQEALRMAGEGRELLAKGRYDEALSAVEKAHRMAPDSSRVTELRSELRQEADRRRRDEALVKRFEAAREAAAVKRFSEAAAELRHVLEVAPDHAEARRLLETVNAEARAAAQKSEGRELAAKARAAMEKRDYAAARRLLEERLHKVPEDSQARALLQEALSSQTMTTEATLVETAPRAQPPPRPPPPGAPRAAASPTRVVEREDTTRARRTTARGVGATERAPSPMPLVGPSGEAVPGPRVAPRPLPIVPVSIAAAAVLAVLAGIWAFRGGGEGTDVVAAPGLVALDVSPWAEIRSVRNAASGETVQPAVNVTPCRLSLPGGRYEIVLSNPHFPEALTVSVEVVPGQLVRLHETIPGFDLEKFLPEF